MYLNVSRGNHERALQDIASLGKMLAQFLALFADCFHGVKGRRLLLVYLKGLLSGLQRKNVEAIALQQGVPPKNAPAIPRVAQVGPRRAAPPLPKTAAKSQWPPQEVSSSGSP